MTMNSAAASFSEAVATAAATAPAAPTPVGDMQSLVPQGTQSQPITTPAAPAANGDWYAGIQDESIRSWAQAKGWKDPSAVAESAYNLEKLIGFDRAGRTIVIPKDDAPPAEIDAYRAKIGVPKTPDEYKIPVPDGGDPEFAKTAQQWFHKAGIPAKAAVAIATEWNAFAQQAVQQQAERQAEVADQEFARVVSEWGKDADSKLELGRRAAAQFIPAANPAERGAIMSKIESAVGTRTMLAMFASIGAGLGEHRLIDGGSGGGFTTTPAEAQAKIMSLKSDKAWTSAYINGDRDKLAEMERLHKIAFPDLGG